MIGSCGHQCAETVSVRYHDEVCDALDGFQLVIVYAEFCPACAKAAKAWPEYIPPDPAEAKQGRDAVARDPGGTMTTPIPPHIVEEVARVLCERRIRIVRRWDTPKEKLEERLPAAIDYAWPDHVDDATAAIEAYLRALAAQEE